MSKKFVRSSPKIELTKLQEASTISAKDLLPLLESLVVKITSLESELFQNKHKKTDE